MNEIYKKNDMNYMNLAMEWSKFSYCKKKKVGAVIVKNNRIISDGYNGTPSGFDNICEDQNGYTKWYVLHAEANAILKLAYSSQSCKGATLYITHFPCKECSKLIHQSKIERVVYFYQCSIINDELNFLKKSKIIIDQLRTQMAE
ncbi:MAG: dCMP deaminase family protein [Flavobacteriales bacterium]|uniref:deoxycytidylate deaminase n=1 Tax=Blattabacterium sp. (Mastotermes darwiniensis) TaxID=39768 RepID=UPI000231DDE9|nr:dCMP deaminase family protein [Blattabacterium sp. (Mastotermes darwiniensis)]AER40541.1 dCMP deaminase [Blattabacterium sp. (Mastotermes darwiniensis) str. MADAR]MDR1804945.1 dCMP deaminase family protein [Flavobacteriales bacterium]